MSDQKEYDNELKGFMWHENDSTIHRKGSITINGQKKYSAIVESTNDKGEKKHELMVSVGLLHVNSEDQKKSESSPDIGGKITIDGTTYKFGGWKKESKEGTPYTSCSLRLVESDNAEKVPF
jgi:hypothetical protein|tara:strand:+ start:527 stop:892 length:366 start_codon:yes stop_codon:yes gene_type:complete